MKDITLLLIIFLLSNCSAPTKFGEGENSYTQSDIRRIMRQGNEQEIQKLLEVVSPIRSQPLYPPELATFSIHGWVEIEFTITPEGRTTDIIVTDSYPKGVFDKVSIEAVEQWRYRPEIVNEKTVEKKGVKTKLSF